MIGYSFDKFTDDKPDEYASAVKNLLYVQSRLSEFVSNINPIQSPAVPKSSGQGVGTVISSTGSSFFGTHHPIQVPTRIGLHRPRDGRKLEETSFIEKSHIGRQTYRTNEGRERSHDCIAFVHQ